MLCLVIVVNQLFCYGIVFRPIAVAVSSASSCLIVLGYESNGYLLMHLN